MKRSYLKRFLALTVAGAVTVSSMPASFAFAEEAPGAEVVELEVMDEAGNSPEAGAEPAEEIVEEVLIAEEASWEASVETEVPVETEAPVETEVPAEEAVTEQVPVDELEIVSMEYVDTAEVEDTLSLEAGETPQQPGQVGNVRFDADDGDVLRWNNDDAADYYEISVTDSKGYEYYGDWDYVDDEEGNSSLVVYYVEEDALAIRLNTLYLYAFKKDATTGQLERDYSKESYLSAGETYTLCVRGVNELNGQYAYGAWSAPVSYAVAEVAPEKVTNLKIEEDQIIWTSGQGSRFEMEVTDSLGRQYFTGWEQSDDGQVTYNYSRVWNNSYLSDYDIYLWQTDAEGNITEVTVPSAEDPTVQKYVKAFELGGTYTIRVRATNGKTGAAKNCGDWSEPAVYTVANLALPEKTGMLSYENNSLSWNSLKDVSGYELLIKDAAGLEYKDVSDETPAYYRTYGNSLYVPEVNNLKASNGAGEVKGFTQGQTYTVQVRGYNRTKDGKEQFGEWSDPYTFTWASVPAPAQVSGVTVIGTNLRWNSLEGADGYRTRYEIMAADVDETGAVRTYLAGVNNDDTPQYCSVGYSSGVDLDEVALYVWTKVDGSWKIAKHSQTGKKIQAFEEGRAYAIYVRGVRTGNGENLYGPWSEAVSFTVPCQPIGINAAPAKVSGVTLKTSTNAEEASLSGTTLSWNYVENAAYYEILVKDGAGREFVEGYDYEDMSKGILTPNYLRAYSDGYYPSYTLSGNELKSYVKAANTAVDTVKDASGKELTAFTAGETYTLQVRAVNTYQVWDAATGEYAEAQVFPGEWSDAVVYTAGALAPITDLTYVSADEEYYYFTYSAALANSAVYYQIAADPNFTAATLVSGNGWYRGNDSQNKLAIAKDDFDLTPGTTYYVRAINSQIRPKEDEVLTVVPSVAAFTTEAVKTPKNITNLTLYNTYKDYYEFRFDAVLDEEYGDHFVLQYTDKAGAAESDWVNGSNDSSRIYNSWLKEGTVYVRAVAYVYRKDAATGASLKVYGVPSNVVTIAKAKATSTISGLKLAEKSADGYTFTYEGSPRKDELIEYWYSETSGFDSDPAKTESQFIGGYDDDDEFISEPNKFTIFYYDLTPGKTYYVRARVYNSAAETEEARYSAFTNVVKVKAAIPKIEVSSGLITSDSITLQMSVQSNEKYLTGYQVQKKVSGKWVTLGKTTDNTYKDTKLTKDTEYSYRVRPYYCDSETGKTTNGSWAYCDATTWGGALKLTAKAASKDSVKLSWTKVSGATGYEVLRLVGKSGTTKIVNGRSNAYGKYQLLKDITKGTTVSYTDKKLNSELSYYYQVRAYKTVDGKKYYISEYAYVDLAFGSFVLIDRINNSDGKVKVTWSPSYSADGYLIEKLNAKTGKWSKVKTLKASSSSYTFGKTTDNKGVTYRIRAYKGTEYSNAAEVTVYPYLAAPTSVKAKANNADGSITVTWKAVAGADYYRVYRTTSSWKVYNETSKSYSYSNYEEVPVYVADSTKVSGYKRVTDTKDLKATKVVDRPITYTNNGVTNTLYAGPALGVKYYYFVVAYKNGAAYNYTEGSYDGGTIGGCGSNSASAMVTGIKLAAPSIQKPAVAAGKITVKWKKVSDAEGYEVYRSTKKDSGYALLSTITKNTTVSYADNTVESNKTYYYKVRAYKANEAGINVYSGYSSVKQVKAAKVTFKLSKPSIKAPAAKKGQITVKWKKVSGVTGFEVYRSTKKSSGYTKIGTVTKASATSYVDKTVKAKKTYYYKVRAYKTVGGTTGYSKYSAVKKIKAK